MAVGHALVYRCGGSTRWRSVWFINQISASCFPFNCTPRTARGHQNGTSVVDGRTERQSRSPKPSHSSAAMQLCRSGQKHYTLCSITPAHPAIYPCPRPALPVPHRTSPRPCITPVSTMRARRFPSIRKSLRAGSMIRRSCDAPTQACSICPLARPLASGSIFIRRIAPMRRSWFLFMVAGGAHSINLISLLSCPAIVVPASMSRSPTTPWRPTHPSKRSLVSSYTHSRGSTVVQTVLSLIANALWWPAILQVAIWQP